jgi:predicted lipid-binding transport protein (Tim44 family)
MQIQFDGRGRGPLESILYGTLLIAVLVLGFFFLVAALIAGAVLAGIILLRLWWLKRKLASASQDEFITTEYRVVEREQLDAPAAEAAQRANREAER